MPGLSRLAIDSAGEWYRARAAQNQLVDAANSAVRATADGLERGLPSALDTLLGQPPVAEPPPELPSARIPQLAARDVDVTFRGQRWLVHLEMTNDAAIAEWLTIADGPTRRDAGGTRKLSLRISLAHEF